MNWVFGAYSSVYNTAMMADVAKGRQAQPRSATTILNRVLGRR